MAVNGDFIQGYGAGKAAGMSQQIAEDVTEWLEENVSPDSGYVIDKSFSIEGAAPDAKETGNRFKAVEDDAADLKSAINTLQPAATASDVGKALIIKTVADGKPTEYEYGEAGGGGNTSNCAPVIIDTASGAIASFEDGADGMPIKKLVVNIEPVQTGSGDPSSTNVRPISGWTGANVVVSPTTDAQDGTTYPISWQSEAGTVYAGTLDVTTGLLTVTHSSIVFTGEEAFTLRGPCENGNLFQCNVAPGIQTVSYLYNLCTHFAPMNPNRMDQTTPIWKIGSFYNSVIFSAPFETVADFKAWFREQYNNGIPVTTVFPYDNNYTKPTYQLTPTEVTLLLGDNNVWADTGDTTVTYRADTKLYIQKINKPSDDNMTADAQIASGKYFIIGNNLYLSTTTIPAGDTIIPGTNCMKTNLAEALNALNT